MTRLRGAGCRVGEGRLDLSAKFAPPAPGGLARSRLLELGAHRVVLVLAPAGHGKTTLLGQIASRFPGPVVWYRIDAADRDPAELAGRIGRALARVGVGGAACGSFDDVAALVALYRPGPMAANMHNDYADYKNERKPRKELHPEVSELLKDTYSLMIYQESMMRVAQKFAGYSLADADNLRKACGKKDRELIAKERQTVPTKTALQDKFVADQPTMKAFSDLVQTARARTGELGAEWPKAATKIYTAVQAALAGGSAVGLADVAHQRPPAGAADPVHVAGLAGGDQRVAAGQERQPPRDHQAGGQGPSDGGCGVGAVGEEREGRTPGRAAQNRSTSQHGVALLDARTKGRPAYAARHAVPRS